ncbi:hypothetical protein D5F11_021520 [Siminovitchia terrae]|uniref:Uncharacterized protein n=1 Tax=Siminovitchia terrae TaxID=1914933 RepID=A0A429X2H1_SIMTE|nr:hypothetical protein [Siminovitchia terrae]RST57642.1 hypothetical protein D5F11_021520 [Siminovitchia terrae]
MAKDAWVLRLKPEIAEEHHGNETLYLTDDEELDFLTDDIQKAQLVFDKEKEIESMKTHERIILEKFGPGAICDFGYTNITKNFDWVEVEVEEETWSTERY